MLALDTIVHTTMLAKALLRPTAEAEAACSDSSNLVLLVPHYLEDIYSSLVEAASEAAEGKNI